MDPDEGLLHEWAFNASQPMVFRVRHNEPPNLNTGVVESYQFLYENTPSPLLFYVHDDVACREHGWDLRIAEEFEDPTVGAVGLGGATQHGRDDIYKTPYDYRQLGRLYYCSNVDDAEAHGFRFSGAMDVATIDGFGFAVRTELLSKAGGWPVDTPVGYVGYDYWLTCMAHRLGYKVRMVGIRCHHFGGRTFTKLNLSNAQAQYDEAHRYIYDEFKDVLPWRV